MFVAVVAVLSVGVVEVFVFLVVVLVNVVVGSRGGLLLARCELRGFGHGWRQRG